MISNEEKVRAAVAEQAGEWFVANDEAPLGARESAALAAWLKASPVHIEEFLRVSVIARDLKEARSELEYPRGPSRGRTGQDDAPVQPIGHARSCAVRSSPYPAG